MIKNNLSDNIKILSDGEIELKLSLGLESTKQFDYVIYCLNENRRIGLCGIRMQKTDENYYLGNIEYEIFPYDRGNHYAEKASRLLAKVASYYNVDSLIITANPENKPSIKTIENLGASFIEIKKVPKNMSLYKTGNHYVSIYEWNLKEKGERNL